MLLVPAVVVTAGNVPCWSNCTYNLLSLDEDMSHRERCELRHATLQRAKAACEKQELCGGITQDFGISCGVMRPKFELRLGARDSRRTTRTRSWLMKRTAPCEGLTDSESQSALQLRVERQKRIQAARDSNRPLAQRLTREVRDAMLSGRTDQTGATQRAITGLGREQASAILYEALQQAHGFGLRGANQSERVEGSSNIDQQFEYRRFFWHRDIRVMCETGFNAGLSAANYLLANYFGHDLTYVGFDLGEHNYSRRAEAYLQTFFGSRRVHVYWGDSSQTLRAYRAQQSEHNGTARRPMCDAVMVDGLHTCEGAFDDLEGFYALSRIGSLVAIDDADMPSVRSAWRAAVNCDLVKELGVVTPGGKCFAVGRRLSGGNWKCWSSQRRLCVQKSEALRLKALGIGSPPHRITLPTGNRSRTGRRPSTLRSGRGTPPPLVRMAPPLVRRKVVHRKRAPG